MKRIGDSYAFVCVLLISTALLCAAAEWGAGVALDHMAARVPPALRNLDEAQIKALYGVDEPAAVARAQGALRESWSKLDLVYEPFVEFRTRPVEGEFVNVHPFGHRLTEAGQAPPRRSDGRVNVFVFGGSTTLGLGVADDQTLPAALQAALRRVLGPDVHVYNLAVAGHFSTQESILFRSLLARGQAPDAAVFVDGLNDFFFCEVPDRSMLSKAIFEGLGAREATPLWQVLAARSQMVRLLAVWAGKVSVTWGGGGRFCTEDDELDRVILRLSANRRAAGATAQAFGVKALFVHQPVPTWGYDETKRPVAFDSEHLAYHANSRAGYARFEALRQRGVGTEPGMLWLHELQINANMYIDTVHYSPQMNAALGEAIARQLLADGLGR